MIILTKNISILNLFNIQILTLFPIKQQCFLLCNNKLLNQIEFILPFLTHPAQPSLFTQKHMSAACSFQQTLIQAYQHLHYEYAACLTCYQTLLSKTEINDFQRLSLFQTKGNEKISKTKKINDQLREFLQIKKISLSDPFILQAIDQFFTRYNSFNKSRFSDTSTSPSQGIQHQQLLKPKQNRFQSLFQTKVEENKNIQKLIQIKDKIAQTGNSFIQKIKQNQKIQKQVENLNAYKQRLMETGSVMKNKFFKLKSQVSDMSSQLPSLKQTLKGVARFGFLKKW